ncbi:MAG: spermidine/putrescine ABC transporter substrate-binding protein [Candidatus Babeliales bacterium]
MKKNKFYIRLLMIAVWILLFGMFISLPYLSSLWQSQKAINLLTWANTIDPKVIDAFEQETGIKVNTTYFDSNEELFVKFYTSKGEGYDLIMPSDYLMEKLIHFNLLKPIDKSRLDFWDRLLPRLLNHYFDPENTYSVPYYWAIYGIGVNKAFFKERLPLSWSLLFSYPISNAKVGMVNIAREAILISALYLFNSIDQLNQEKIEEIKKLLLNQKKRVEAYIDADVRSNYMLISQASPVVIAASPYIAKAIQSNNNLDFLVPDKGSFILIDNLAISARCEQTELVYKLINFLYRPENIRYHIENQPFIGTTKELLSIMKEEQFPASIINAHFDETKPLFFFKNIISEDIANNIWISLKVS